MISWYGRKATFLPWLLPLLPTTGVDTFVDAFGGSGSVICRRPPVARNIYAERDQALVDLFCLLQDRAAAERLVAALRLTPWHRAEYDRWFRGWYRWDHPTSRECLWTKLRPMNRTAAIKWYGGKTIHLPWLLPLLPAAPVFVDAFGGSGAVILNRPAASRREVYNDLDDRIVAIYRALQTEPAALRAAIRLTPWHRSELARALRPPDAPLATVEFARRAFVALREIRQGLTKATPRQFSYDRRVKTAYPQMVELADRLEMIVPRLRQITIRHEDALAVLQEEDGPDTLHYVDPPYLHDTRTGGEGYRFEYSDAQHAALVDLLRSLTGRVALSGYRSPAYDQAFADGRWHRYDAPIARAR